MNFTKRREQMRAVLAGNECVHPGSVYDPISARIAEDLGFEVGMFAGSIASATVLGAPDLIVLTLSEFAQQIHRICRAGELPLLVDADHGYGNALNVKRTVEELETAGVSALTIEDTDLPRPFGPSGSPTLISIEEGVGNMKAALSGRQDPALVVAGRTSAIGIAGVEEAIKRSKAYEAAGVDAMFLAGAGTRADVEAVRAEISIPIFLGSTPPELADKAYLASQGVKIALQGHMPFMAGVNAVYETLKALREGTKPSDLQGVASSELINQVTRNSDYSAWTKDFLSE